MITGLFKRNRSLSDSSIFSRRPRGRDVRLSECIVKLYHTARSFVLLTGDEDLRINKCMTLSGRSPQTKR